jgi:hypothetical protein
MAAAGKHLEIVRGARWRVDVASCGGRLADDAAVLAVQEHLLEHRNSFGLIALEFEPGEEVAGPASLHVLLLRLPKSPDHASLLRLQGLAFTERELAYWKALFPQ